MLIRLAVAVAALMAAFSLPPALRAQTSAASGAATAQSQSGPSKVPDMSGDWSRIGGVPVSVSPSDRGGNMRGKETDIPYQPWALAKTMSEIPPAGPDNQIESTTDPNEKYCEPLGLVRIYAFPARIKLIQTPEAVYILHEVGPYFRMVRLNSKHVEDPDPQWWGDSIGRYENGDTLVIDTIGANGKTWLDQSAHPTTDKLHLIERFKRVDANTLDLDMTIDDPGAYTKPFTTHLSFAPSKIPFLAYQWACSVRENMEWHNLFAPAAPTTPPSN